METNLKFNSAICTSLDQSKRLLALGLKNETADCCWSFNIGVYDESRRYTLVLGKCEYMHDIPAWSLHRLIEIADTYIEFSPFTGVNFQDGSFSTNRDNDYDAIIDIIEWLIQKGHFNKEYLEEL